METESDLPECSPQEMWEKPTVWALKRAGKLRASSLHYTEEDANEALAKAGKEFEIEVRPGERTRCATFCPVNAYCQQWRDYQESSK
jgi:hypothetical protein